MIVPGSARGLVAAVRRKRVTCRTATTPDGEALWQFEVEGEPIPPTRKFLTMTNEELAALLEMRGMLLRDPAEIVATLQRRDKANRDLGTEFVPISIEPQSVWRT